MFRSLAIFGLLFGSGAVALVPTVDSLQVKEGFEVNVFAEGVGKARHVVARENGDVFVHLSESSEGAIVALRDTNGDQVADNIKYFEDQVGTGLEIYKNYLYFSSDTAVYRRQFKGNELIPSGPREVVVQGFPDQDQHAAKAFTISPEGELYVNVGAPSNSCQIKDREVGSLGMDPCPLLEDYAGIWKFSATALNQEFSSAGRYASGIRNVVALDWNTQASKLYIVQHGRDSLNELFPEFYTAQQSAELPAEQFLALSEGYVGSWPYAYWDHFQNQFTVSPEYGGNGQKTTTQYAPPIYGFPAHYAPNDLIFYRSDQFGSSFKGAAFIAFHGSWNRLGFPQEGYQVSYLPMKEGLPAGESQIFLTGFTGADKITAPDQAKYRAMGLAEMPDGSLLVVDSVQGRIWRVSEK